jgi:hypothetical protein
MVEIDVVDRRAELAERMDIFVADPAPVRELDAELDRRLRLAHEIDFVEPERVVEVANVRDGRFADSDDSDLRRLDQPDRDGPPQFARQCRRRHPTGAATANDQDAAHRLVGHSTLPRRILAASHCSATGPSASSPPATAPLHICNSVGTAAS